MTRKFYKYKCVFLWWYKYLVKRWYKYLVKNKYKYLVKNKYKYPYKKHIGFTTKLLAFLILTIYICKKFSYGKV